MSDLEQRLVDELDLVATDLRAPDLSVPGLVAAGRRERSRGRALVAAVAAAVLAAVVAAGVALPGGDSSPEPAPIAPTTGTDDVLDRPLELPWWGSDESVLYADGAEIEVDATRILHAHGVTLAQHGRRWSVVTDGRLAPLSSTDLTGDPMIGPDGTIAWLEDHLDDDPRLGDPEAGAVPVQYVLNIQAPGGVGARSAATIDAEVTCCDAGGVLELVAVLPDGRPLLTRSGLPEVWDRDLQKTVPVTGVPAGVTVGYVAPWPGGAGGQRDSAYVVAARVDGRRWQSVWEASGDGAGAWSDDGELYAEGVRVSTRAGTTVLPLEEDDLRVVAWESTTEVVIAQWVRDAAVERLWRCSAVELRCSEIEGAPAGRILLPGL